MLRQFSSKRIIGFFLLDWLGTLAMLLLAAALRPAIGGLPKFGLDFLTFLGIRVNGVAASTGLGALPVQVIAEVAILWPFFFIVFSVYDGRRNDTLKAELLNVFLAICVAFASQAGILYLTYRGTSRLMFVLFFTLDVVLLLGSRVAWAVYRRRVGLRPRDQRRVLIVGAGVLGRNVAAELQKYGWADLKLVGYLDDDPAKLGQELDGLPVLGTLDRAAQIAVAQRIESAVVALPLEAHERMVQVCRELQETSVRVNVIPDLFALTFPNATLDGFGGIPLIDLGERGIHGLPRLAKRAFDVLAVSIGLLCLAPVLTLIAILIKLDSPGPVLYRQVRIGENGRRFTMFKFRSMRTNSETGLHREHVTRLIQQNLTPEELNGGNGGSLKMENDPRITRFGRFIRKTSLDELPQLFNVLRGEMSLVGPRPPLPYEVEVYKDWHLRRLEAPPGITGLWQVKAHNRVSFDEMVRLDLEYIEKQSLWLDVKILLQTPFALLTDNGSG